MILRLNQLRRNRHYEIPHKVFLSTNTNKKKALCERIENNGEELKSNKEDVLLYLSRVFNEFQNFISRPSISNSKVINHWKEYSSKAEHKKIFNLLCFLNKHGNFTLLNKHIISNFNDYQAKEIAFISKVYNAINLTPENELSSKINKYCESNISKFDLHDIFNITFNNNKKFIQASSEYVLEKIKEQSNSNLKLSVDSNEDKFENEMSKFDVDTNFWLKVNILKHYKNTDSNELLDSVSTLFKQSEYLTKNGPKFYELNYVINLCAASYKLASNLDASIVEPFIHEDVYLYNLDLCEYKSEFYNYFKFLIKRKGAFNEQQYKYLIDYFQDKIFFCKNPYLFFEYTQLFNELLMLKSSDVKIKENLKLNFDRKFKQQQLHADMNPFYLYLVKNLDEKFKLNLENKYDKFIEAFDGLSFKAIVYSIPLLFNSHQNPNAALNRFYENILDYLSSLNQLNSLQILSMIKSLLALIDYSNYQNEIDLCSLIDLKFILADNANSRTKMALIIFFMLNKKTCLNNFKIISSQLKIILSTNYNE